MKGESDTENSRASLSLRGGGWYLLLCLSLPHHCAGRGEHPPPHRDTQPPSRLSSEVRVLGPEIRSQDFLGIQVKWEPGCHPTQGHRSLYRPGSASREAVHLSLGCLLEAQ